MRTVHTIILPGVLAGCMLLLNACLKNLQTSPQTFQTDITSFDDLKAEMAGAYDGLKSNAYYSSNYGSPMAWSSLPDIMGDDFIEAYESFGNWRTVTEWRYAADEGIVSSAFSQAYKIIGNTNDVLQNAAAYETGSTAADAFRLEAQAKALRAHCHFDLMRYFASSYARNSDSLGIAYVTKFSPDNPLADKPSRLTVKQCYDSVYQDLSEALAVYRQYGDLENDNRYGIDSLTIHAMLARIGLYCGEYAQAVSDASVVIDALPLADVDTYPKIWSDETTSEVVWQVPNDQVLRPGFANNGDNPSYRVADNFRDLMYSPAGGIRNDSSVIRKNINGVGDVQRTLLFKYAGTRNFKVFRTSEMYLIRSECAYRLTGTGLEDLNTLRTTRGAPAGTETGSNLYNAIFRERRLELIGEGHRWFDIRRTTRTIARDECGSSGNSYSDVCSVGPDSRSWIWPIPFNEININANLMQNPGY